MQKQKSKPQNRYMDQAEEAQKAFNDPDRSLFWIATPGTSAQLKCYEAIMRFQTFNINGIQNQYIVLDVKGTNAKGDIKIASFPSFVVRTATSVGKILVAHDASIMESEICPEDVAFGDRPWKTIKEPFVIEAMFANVKGNIRIVHIKEVIQ